MPVAGGVLHSVDLTVVDGRLIEGAIMHRSSRVVVADVEEAVELLRDIDRLKVGPTQRLYLKLEGMNLSRVREAFPGR